MADERLAVALAQEGAYDLIPVSRPVAKGIAWKIEPDDSFVPLDEYIGDVDGLDGEELQGAGVGTPERLLGNLPPLAAKQEFETTMQVKHETKCANNSAPEATEPHDDAVLQAFARVSLSLEPCDDLQNLALEATSRLSKYARNYFGPRAWLRPHGAWVQGSHMQSSEVQIRLDFRTRKTPRDGSMEVQDENDPQKEMEMHRSSMAKLAQKFINNAQCPFKVLDAEKVKEAPPLEFRVEYFAKESSIKMLVGVGTETGNGVQIDFVDRVIRRMLARTPHAIHLIHLVRQWTEVAELESVSNGFLCPLGWTLLCLFYFVSRGEANSDSLYQAEESEQSDVSALPPMLCGSKGDASIVVLVEFFEMVAGFSTWLEDDINQGTWGISLVTGASLVLGKSCGDAPFFVEDPGVKIATGKDSNVAVGLTLDGWRCILSSCQAAADVLRSQSNVSSALLWLDALLLERGDDSTTITPRGDDSATKTPSTPGKRPRLAEKIAEFAAAKKQGCAMEDDEGIEDPRDAMQTEDDWFCSTCAKVQEGEKWKCFTCGQLKPPGHHAIAAGGWNPDHSKRLRTETPLTNASPTAQAAFKGVGKSGKWSRHSAYAPRSEHLRPKLEQPWPASSKGIVGKGAGKSAQWSSQSWHRPKHKAWRDGP